MGARQYLHFLIFEIFEIKKGGGFSGSATQQPPMCVWVAVGWLFPNSHLGWLMGGCSSPPTPLVRI